ncbi:MAG: hypothetical protein AB9917_21850 [Negativicutes bacterium]
MQKIDSIEQVFHFQNKPKEVFSTASDGHAWHHGKTLWEFGGATRRQIPALFPMGAVGCHGQADSRGSGERQSYARAM